MMKMVLLITLTFAGQPPGETYQTEFDKPADCYQAREAFLRAYSDVYGIWPGGRSLSVLPDRDIYLSAECVSEDNRLLNSN